MGDSAAQEGTIAGLHQGDSLWWVYRGRGIPRSRNTVRFAYLALISIVGFTIWGYVDIRNRGRIEAGNLEVHRTDFTVFTEAGAAFFDGRDPYRVTNPRGWFYLYPPLFALLVSPLALLDSQSQVVVWYALSVALGFGCYFESRRIWQLLTAAHSDARTDRHAAGDAALWTGASVGLTVALPALDCLQRGQLGIVLIYPLLLGMRLILSGPSWLRSWLGGVVLAWPVVVKLIPALPVAFLLLQRWTDVLAPRRGPSSAGRAAALTLGLICGGTLFALVIPAACIGWGKNLHHLETWVGKVMTNPEIDQVAKFHIDSRSNQSLSNAAYLFTATLRGPASDQRSGLHWLAVDRAIADRRRADHVTRWVVRFAQAAVLVLLAAVALRVSLRRDELGQAAVYGLAALATLLVSPLAWAHYYVFALPAALTVPLWLRRRGWPIAARGFAAGLPVLTCLHYVLMPWCGPVGLLGLGTTLWFLAVCSIALVVRAPSKDEKSNPPDSFRTDLGHDLYLGNHSSLCNPLPESPTKPARLDQSRPRLA
jgi:cell division protein FtsW (lipid II flippase)